MKDLVTYEGRVGRLRYCGVLFFVYFGCYVVIRSLGEAAMHELPLSYVAYLLFAFWVMMCNYVKRLHDMDRPGTDVIFIMVPIYNLYLYYLLFFSEGTAGPNRYGLADGGASHRGLAAQSGKKSKQEQGDLQ